MKGSHGSRSGRTSTRSLVVMKVMLLLLYYILSNDRGLQALPALLSGALASAQQTVSEAGTEPHQASFITCSGLPGAKALVARNREPRTCRPEWERMNQVCLCLVVNQYLICDMILILSIRSRATKTGAQECCARPVAGQCQCVHCMTSVA